MTQRKIMQQVTLTKNQNGTYFCNIEIDAKPLRVFLGKQKVANKDFYCNIVEGEHYLASMNLTNTGAFVDQLLPVSLFKQNQSKLQCRCHCQLTKEGKIKLRESNSESTIVLPKNLVYALLYRIFHNSQVVVIFGHTQSGFCIEKWQTLEPEYIQSGQLTRIRKKSDDPEEFLYLANYYVTGKTYLPVLLPKKELNKLGIHEVTEQAVIAAELIQDHNKGKSNVNLSLTPAQILELHNRPQATLIFLTSEKIKQHGDLYHFKTQTVNHMSLAVSAWASELEYFVEDVSSLSTEDKIKVALTHQINGEWCNFKLPVASANEYDQQFRCIKMKRVGREGMALIETVKPPCVRTLIARSTLIKKGIYSIHSGVTFDLHIVRPTCNDAWDITAIDPDFFVGIQHGDRYKAKAIVMNAWSRYDNRPDYLVKLVRNQKNYGFKNHAVATTRNQFADLIVIIPKALLIAQGFQTLKVDEQLSIVFTSIEFPLYTTEAIPILCADDLLDSKPIDGRTDNGIYVWAEFSETLPPYQSNERYRFRLTDRDETADFIDSKEQLSGIELNRYRFKIRIKVSNRNSYIKEIISASVK